MLKFIKNVKPNFDIKKISLKINRLKLDNRNHPENKAIKGLDRVASTQNKVWDEDLPKEVIDYISKIGFHRGTYSANVNVQRPGQMAPLHKDNHQHASKKLNRSSDEFERVLVFLTDWSIGQVFGCEEKSITSWKCGDCYTFETEDQHFSANTGVEDKYTIVISVLKESI